MKKKKTDKKKIIRVHYRRRWMFLSYTEWYEDYEDENRALYMISTNHDWEEHVSVWLVETVYI